MTERDRSPALQVAAYFLAVVNVLAVLTQTGRRLLILKRLRTDDICILTALAISIGQTAATLLQTTHGFGSPISTLTHSDVLRAEKADYIANLLSIACLCFTKLWLVIFLWHLTPRTLDRALIAPIGAFVIVWTISSFLGFAFQCKLPTPWDYLYGECINRTALWVSFCVINIVTDVVLTVVPFFVVLRTQAALLKRLHVCLFFSLRLFVIVPIVCQLVWLRSDRQDPTLDPWKVILCRQLIQSASIIASCMAQFKRVLNALDSGMTRVSDPRRQGLYGLDRSSGRTPSNSKSLSGYGYDSAMSSSTGRNARSGRVASTSNPNAIVRNSESSASAKDAARADSVIPQTG